MQNDRRVEKLTRVAIALLQEEREALMTGALDELEGVTQRKNELIEELEGLLSAVDAGGPAPLIADRRAKIETLFEIIRRRSSENQFLLKSAQAGVQSAAAKLREIFGSDKKLGVYDAQGDKVDTSSVARSASQFL